MAYWEWRTRLGRDVGYCSFSQDANPNRNQRHWIQYEAIPMIVRLRHIPSTDSLEVTGIMKKATYNNLEFVTFKLQREEADLFEAWWDKEQQRVPDILQELINGGYKVSITPDFDNACTIVTLIGKDCITENKKRAYSSRADGWLEAFGLMAYKHFVLSSAQAWPESSTMSNWG